MSAVRCVYGTMCEDNAECVRIFCERNPLGENPCVELGGADE